MGAMTLTFPAPPVSLVDFNKTVRIKRRKTLLAGYKLSHRGKTYMYTLAWNAFYQLAVKSIPDDFYDWQDDALDLFLEEHMDASS